MSLAASFMYDGDGKRMAQTINGETTYFVGNYYEVSGSTITKYYYAGSQKVAMRVGSTVYYLLSDHLGSTSLTLNASGSVISELRYTSWGSVRYQAGVTPTEYTYTGQYSESYLNLLDYGSRRYDPETGRFISPDSIVPTSIQGLQAYDRYGYVSNNPIQYNDPTGHFAFLATAAIGAAVGFTVSYGTQVYRNMNEEKMSLTDALDFSNIDKQDLIVATVGGAVAGATMGIASGIVGSVIYGSSLAGGMVAFAGEYVVGGAAAGLLAGQAEALAEAATNTNGQIILGQNENDFNKRARAVGYMNGDKMILDAGVGAITGTLGGIMQTVTAPVPHGPEVLPKTMALGLRAFADETLEYMNRNR
jgi:RHS repeat-associated protein